MRQQRALPLVLLAVFLGSTPAFSADTAIRCGRLLDPASGRVTENAVILVRGERVEQVGTAVPSGARTVDLSRHTCLPGLIDPHTHVLLRPEDERGAPPVVNKSQAFRTIQGVAAARKDLEAGFTTLRDLDSEGAGFADVAIRDAINQGIVPGAELLRMEKEIGTVEPGKYADVIAVEGDPLQDIGTLGRVVFVMKAGEVYKRP